MGVSERAQQPVAAFVRMFIIRLAMRVVGAPEFGGVSEAFIWAEGLQVYG